eukprot:TRINITY_DN1747_c0_g1_i1.p1 TRINITY_DN1747_c0_g1~~TRINITY_DN1747_c0_g1_i1.p1  ORF type:complete len:332 (+),score=97.89 TRINITY_DN1747_c0_g1_i1:93-1088(+)
MCIRDRYGRLEHGLMGNCASATDQDLENVRKQHEAEHRYRCEFRERQHEQQHEQQRHLKLNQAWERAEHSKMLEASKTSFRMSHPMNLVVEGYVLKTVREFLSKNAEVLGYSARDGNMLELVFSGMPVTNRESTLEHLGMHEGASYQIHGLSNLQEHKAQLAEAAAVDVLQAATTRDRDALELVAMHAPERICSSQYDAPLCKAATQGACEAIELLIEFKACVHSHFPDGKTALHNAALAGQHGATGALLTARASVDCADVLGNCALHDAVCAAVGAEHVKVVKLLLAAGADAHQPNNLGRCALDLILDPSVARGRELYQLLTGNPGLCTV